MNSNITQLLESDHGRLLKRAIRPLTRFVRKLELGQIDLFAPEGMVDRFYRGAGLVLGSIPADFIRAGLAAFVHDDSFWTSKPMQVGLTPKVRAVCDFFRSLDARWPFASNVLILGSRCFQRGFLIDYLRAVGQLQRATVSRRERRAEWLRQANTTIVESLYYEFVSIVYAAQCLKNGEQLRLSRGGSQLRYLAEATSSTLPEVFVGHEGRLRNAAVHYDRWRYVPATNTIRLTDANWAAEYATSEMLAESRELLADSTLPVHVMVRLHGFESRPLLKSLFGGAASPELASLEHDYQETETELRRLGWRPQRDSLVRGD